MMAIKKYYGRNSGFTLVELLVAISIMTIVVALVVPRLRIVNKDRNIRETARVVGSAISSARDLAIAEGNAGVIIERNLNFMTRTQGENNRVFYAGARMYQMRAKSPYTGDSDNDFGLVFVTEDSIMNPTLQCLIVAPLDHVPPNREVVMEGDQIELGNFDYQVKEVLPVVPVTFMAANSMAMETICGIEFTGSITLQMLPLNMAFDNDAVPTNAFDLSQPDFVTGVPSPRITVPTSSPLNLNQLTFMASTVQCFSSFQVKRLRRILSSVVNLPAGYIIDLRYSGPFDSNVAGGFDADPETHTVMSLGLPDGVDETLPINRDIQILFGRRGEIEKLNINGGGIVVGQSLNLFIHEYDPNQLIDNDTRLQAEQLLAGDDNLWVTVGLNGGINIGYNAPPDPGTVQQMISAAQTIARNRTSAAQ